VLEKHPPTDSRVPCTRVVRCTRCVRAYACNIRANGHVLSDLRDISIASWNLSFIYRRCTRCTRAYACNIRANTLHVHTHAYRRMHNTWKNLSRSTATTTCHSMCARVMRVRSIESKESEEHTELGEWGARPLSSHSSSSSSHPTLLPPFPSEALFSSLKSLPFGSCLQPSLAFLPS
jgi:hypothetical protein